MLLYFSVHDWCKEGTSCVSFERATCKLVHVRRGLTAGSFITVAVYALRDTLLGIRGAQAHLVVPAHWMLKPVFIRALRALLVLQGM